MPSSAAEQAFRQALEAQQAGRYEEAVQLLSHAASQDHVQALSLLGGQLLTGRGVKPDFASGLALIRRAAELDGAYARAVVAASLCYGVDGPADWKAGLDQLQRSAELGYGPAGAQLRILAELTGPQPPAASWAGLRRAIDLDAWRRPPPVETLSADPEIRIVPGLAPKPACDWLISSVRDRLQRALVHTPDDHRLKANDVRTNSFAVFRLTDANVIVMMLQERLGAAAGVGVRHMEGPQVLHYAAGQQYQAHFDFMEPFMPGNAALIQQYGQRTATLLIYLNQGFQGGETEFHTLGIRYKGAAGDALMFRNVDRAGAPDRRMGHAGLPPSTGEKWLFSQWVRDRLQH